VIAFLDVLVITEVYRKPTHTGRYLNFSSNHPQLVERGLIQSLHNRASTIGQERQDLVNEISNLRSDLQLNGYPQGFIDSIINSKGSGCLNKEEKPLGSVYIPYMKVVSGKFKHIRNRYNIGMIFKTKHTLRSSLLKTRPERDLQQSAQFIYRIPYECGRSYTGEGGGPLGVWLYEHRQNLQQGFLKKSKLAQHAY
jgi:hypothetical protein